MEKLEGFRVKCKFCGYDWKPKVEKPKECPRCHRYLDMERKKVRVKKRLVCIECLEISHDSDVCQFCGKPGIAFESIGSKFKMSWNGNIEIVNRLSESEIKNLARYYKTYGELILPTGAKWKILKADGTVEKVHWTVGGKMLELQRRLTPEEMEEKEKKEKKEKRVVPFEFEVPLKTSKVSDIEKSLSALLVIWNGKLSMEQLEKLARRYGLGVEDVVRLAEKKHLAKFTGEVLEVRS